MDLDATAARRDALLAELRHLVDRGVERGTTATPEGVLLSRVDAAGPPAVAPSGTVLAIVASGRKEISFADRDHELFPGRYVVTTVDLPVSGRYTQAPASGFGLELRPAVIAELLLQPAARDVVAAARSGGAPSAVAIGEAGVELLDAAVRMLRLLERPRDRAVLAPLVERELVWLLLTGPHGSTVAQLGLAESSLGHVGSAVRSIRERYAEALRVEDLARSVQMSPSAFHRAFRAVTGLSPIQFQKRIRLQEARVRLTLAPGDVAGAAHAVGYESASQFSREYRRQFGTPPGQDAARLRTAAASRE